jgi:hypothetical protein
MGKRNLSKNSSGHLYFFVRPGEGRNVHRTATKLVGLANVRSVEITEGEFGFVLKAGRIDGARATRLARSISRTAGGGISTAVCHCRYERRQVVAGQVRRK